MLNKNVKAIKELGVAFPENCTIEFDLFMSNANYVYESGGPSPTVNFSLGGDPNNWVNLGISYIGSRVYYAVTGLNNTENRVILT